jgi:hypothetical protein
MFDTYGPFILNSHDKSGIDDLYNQIRDDPTAKELEQGNGVYIVAVDDSMGNCLPWYVGKTTRQGFGTRLKQHFEQTSLPTFPLKAPYTYLYFC